MPGLSAVLLSLLALSLLAAASAGVENRGNQIVISMPRYGAVFSTDNGSLLSLTQAGKSGSIVHGGEQGLWHARFGDNSTLDAAAFHAAGDRTCAVRVEAATGVVIYSYTAPELAVTITITPTPEALELQAEVTLRKADLMDFAVPGRLRFAPEGVRRFISPMSSGTSVGIACNGRFFAEQPQDKPSGWKPQNVGPEGYTTLYGAGPVMRPDQDPPLAITVTADGKTWLGEGLASRLSSVVTVVNRPPTPAQTDLTLVDSANGPYFSASHLGGAGYLWRIGGGVDENARQSSVDMIGAVVTHLAQSAPAGRTKIGLLDLRHGPERGGWSQVTVSEWRARLTRAAAGKLQLVTIASADEMIQAAGAGDFLGILNPYGEWAPAPEAGGMTATVAAVGKYVRGGGNWFEVGGYPFYYQMRPLRFLQISQNYPPAFADFVHLDTTAGEASVYRVQPQKFPAWEGARNHDAIFIPGRLACGGDEQGGYSDHVFSALIPPGQTWRPPTVRLAVGQTVAADLSTYCTANAITRRLPDKVDAATLAKLRQSLLVFVSGNAEDKTNCLSLLPSPSLIHFSDYLHGGFDKQYPDHLPPNAWFGTPEQMRTFVEQAHVQGQLLMPYTNPTWWCDHPKGPTFEREGDAPLLKRLDGKPGYERYAQNDGWTITFWHPAVQAANRLTVKQFSEEYPVDVIFQDQNGARGWEYDTNPTSPTPYAYSEGLISQVAEDSKTKPLATEGGWDRVVNSETQLCGMTWALVPTEGSPGWTERLRALYPPETWTVYPVAECIAHDKTMMLHHDLGQFVTNRETLSWTLGLGFSLSYRIGATELSRESRRQWLLWLDRLQKSVCARYIGEPVGSFEQVRGADPTADAEGVIQAQYGPVKLITNLDPTGHTEAGKSLPPFGFYATAPGVVAGNLQQVNGVDDGPDGVCFVAEGDARAGDLWVYAPGGRVLSVEAPPGMKGPVSVTVDGQAAVSASVTNGAVSLKTPEKAAAPRVAPPAELAGKAPRDWRGAHPAVGIIDLGAGLGMSWTDISPAKWVQAFAQSPLAQQSQVSVKRLTTPAEVLAALAAGPKQWLAIVNPYGESFPTAGPGKWQEALAAIRDYVNNGGVWWETAGYSFYRGIYSTPNGWEGDAVGPAGAAFFGVPVGGGDVQAPLEPLQATPQGKRWLGADVAAKVAAAASMVNRAAPRGDEDPGHLALVSGLDQDYIAGYRLGGWGWLWRVGGFGPDPELVPAVVVATINHVYNNPPEPAIIGPARTLWHAKIAAR